MSKSFKQILFYFVIWRICLFFVAFLAIFFLPNFGMRFPYYDKVLASTGLPNWIWGFGNFDGVHYLKLAQEGYLAEYSQAFFPLFPLSFSWLGLILSGFLNYFLSYFLAGFLLTNLFLLFALFTLFKLYRLDYDAKISLLSIYFLFSFPTAFYFGSIYTESSFLLLSAMSFYFMRKKQFLFSGIFVALASLTKLIGVVLIFSLIAEFIISFKKETLITKSKIFYLTGAVLVGLSGLISYMFYLFLEFGNAFYFFTAQPIFGADRSIDRIILLPQVILRYLKIFISVPINSVAFFNSFLEFTFTIGAFLLLIVCIKRVRFSYWIFMFLCLLIPTLTGTFSSMPRYVLGLYLLFPLIVSYKKYKKIIFIVGIVLQLILVSLFTRGYWVA